MSEGGPRLTLILLAGNLVDCGMRPPLLPTQAAILRLLYVVGEAGTGVLLRVVPCNEATIYQQVKRLVDVGLVVKRTETTRKGRVVKVYRLSSGGRRMVEAWEEEARKKLGAIDELRGHVPCWSDELAKPRDGTKDDGAFLGRRWGG